MNDAELPDSLAPALEDTLAAWDDQLAGLERQAGQVLRAAQATSEGGARGRGNGLRRRHRRTPGQCHEIAGRGGPVRDCAGHRPGRRRSPAAPSSTNCPAPPPPPTSRWCSATAASAPTRSPCGWRRARRPCASAISWSAASGPASWPRHLRALQQRPNRFNARTVLDRLFRAYTVLAAARAPDWQPEPPRLRPARPARRPVRPADAAAGRRRRLPAGGVLAATCCGSTASRTPAPAAAIASNLAARPGPRATSA